MVATRKARRATGLRVKAALASCWGARHLVDMAGDGDGW